MKYLRNKLILLVLATVLSISPLQAITASVSDCMDTNKSMSHSMNFSEHSDHQDMQKSAGSQDCCETMACDMTHCAGFVAIAITTDSQNDVLYTLTEVYTKPTETLFQHYPSSLYRPPKA